jgi:hypothetical protein
MRRFDHWGTVVLAAGALLAAAAAAAQTVAAPATPAWGRFSLFVQSSRSNLGMGFSDNTTDVIGNLTMRSASADDGGLEYSIDIRGANYQGSFQPHQVSIYNAYVRANSAGGVYALQAGDMWLNDLGALGSLGGALLEFRPKQTSDIGRFRFGLFGGLEPDPFKAAFVAGVRKAGGYLALDGPVGRRSVLGFVEIKNQGMIERQVATMLNFIPIGRTFFIYQAAEYDLKPPAGLGKTGLNYFFANVRYAPSNVIEFQGMYHHGFSVDARTLTNDEINHVPVDPRLVVGFLFESTGGRISVSVSPRVRVWGGYYRDRNNVDSSPTGRVQAGFWASNVFGSGLDFTVSDNRSNRTGNRFDSWYGSIGASVGRSVYISADYTTSLSVLDFTNSGGVVVESRPTSKRYSINGSINLSRVLSLIVTGERIDEDTMKENRAMLGFTVRF